MRKTHYKYNEYYGELITYDTFVENGYGYAQWHGYETEKFVKLLEENGVINILFDLNRDDNADTLFFEITDKTNVKKLMLLIVKEKPDEFSEESNNCFRMWFD